ncbi:MAG: lysylphosphatidylglycerol synthase transmembrane domain-containing protein [Anaerolineae bacterium]
MESFLGAESTPWHRNWRFWTGATLSIVILGWGILTLDWRQVAETVSRARLDWVALALVTVLLTLFTRLLRWRGLLLPYHFDFMELLTALLVGQMANYLIFSQLDTVVRTVTLSGKNRLYILGTVTLEKFWDVLTLAGLLLVLSLRMNFPTWLILPARWISIAAIAAGLFLVLLALFRDHLTFESEHLTRLLDGLSGLAHPSRLFWGLSGSLMVWGLGATTNYCVLNAFDLVPASRFYVASLLLAALQAGVAVPSLPGNIGVFEAICVAVLTVFEVSQEEALAAGLLLHAVVFVPPLLGGSALMWRREIPFFSSSFNRSEEP